MMVAAAGQGGWNCSLASKAPAAYATTLPSASSHLDGRTGESVSSIETTLASFVTYSTEGLADSLLYQ